MRVKIASETIWAMRRELLGSVTYCWPATCWPLVTSHRRNSVFSRPSGPLPGAPGDDELRIDHAPGIHFRRHVRVADLFDEARRIDRLQKYRALEIIGDDAGQRRPLLRIARKSRDRDRHRLELAARADVEIGRLAPPPTAPPMG